MFDVMDFPHIWKGSAVLMKWIENTQLLGQKHESLQIAGPLPAEDAEKGTAQVEK